MLLPALMLAAAQATEPAATPTLEDVTKSFNELRTSLEVGVLRPQYAEILQQRLPMALAFTKNPPPSLHPDVVAAVAHAVRSYQGALGSWGLANTYWLWAKQAMEFANSIASDPPSRREEQAVRKLVVGENVTGRFGLGDAVEDEGQYVDHFELTIERSGSYRFQTEGGPCDPTPIVHEAGGKALGKWEQSYAPDARTYKLKAGSYKVTVGCMLSMPPAVGQYRLSVSAAK